MHARHSNDVAQENSKQIQLMLEEEARIQSERQAADEDQMANELYLQHCERMKEEKLRQQLRENNQELRELEMKLRAAYVGKAIKAQLAEREVMRLKEKLDLQREQDEMHEKRRREDEESLKLKEKEKERQRALRQVLQNQMVDKRLSSQRLYEEYLKEKKIIDDIVKAILEEQME